jgi:hypothetical protein
MQGKFLYKNTEDSRVISQGDFTNVGKICIYKNAQRIQGKYHKEISQMLGEFVYTKKQRIQE